MSKGARIRSARRFSPRPLAPVTRAIAYPDGTVWLAHGPCIGWIDEPEGRIYLDPEAAYRAVTDESRYQGEPLNASLHEIEEAFALSGQLRTEIEDDRVVQQVLRRVEGQERRVWDLPITAIFPDWRSSSRPVKR